jgi:hypothetical protein
MPKYLGDVRCWVNSGNHMLSLSFSGFDPTRTSRTYGRNTKPVPPNHEVPQGSNEELSKGIVPWNFISCWALASMKKSETLDLMLGSIVLGALLAVFIVSGIVWNIV